MRRLEINPQKFDIELSSSKLEDETSDQYGVAEVYFQFGSYEGHQAMTRIECERVGNWFLALARELKRTQKKKPDAKGK